MPTDPDTPPQAPESTAEIALRLTGFFGLLFGISLGLWLGGRWWFFGPAVFVGTALIWACISIVQRERHKGRHT
jgi:fatty acid desaturase